MEQQTFPPTVELNHEHITTLQSITDRAAVDNELKKVHAKYLKDEYPMDNEGHAQIDDLTLTNIDHMNIKHALASARSQIPIDEHQYLYDVFDHYFQLTVLHPEPEIHDEDIKTDDDDDIIVTDGGVDIVQSADTGDDDVGSGADIPAKPPLIAEIISLSEGDRVAFEARGQTVIGTVKSVAWKTTEGSSEDAGFENVTAHVSPTAEATPFDADTAVLHAGRSRDCDWESDEPVVIDTADMTEDFGQLTQLIVVEEAEDASRTIDPETLADIYHDNSTALNSLFQAALTNVWSQWSEHRTNEALHLIDAGFRPENVRVSITGSPAQWDLQIDHSRTLKDIDGYNVESARDDYFSDIVAEVCDLVRQDIQAARTDER